MSIADITACDGVNHFIQTVFDVPHLDLRHTEAREEFSARFQSHSKRKLLAFILDSYCRGEQDGISILTDYRHYRSRSATSCALYPAYWDLTHIGLQGGLLLQIALKPFWQVWSPFAQTSHHHHDLTEETFYPLSGVTEIRVGKGIWSFLRWEHKVMKGVCHQLRVASRWSWSLNVIRMNGPHFITCMRDHIYTDGSRGQSHKNCRYCITRGYVAA